MLAEHEARSTKRKREPEPAEQNAKRQKISRAENAELKLLTYERRAERARNQYVNKATLMDGIMTMSNFPHVFLCEIVHTHVHADPPKPASGPNERPLSYLYYANGVRTPLTNFPTASGAGWYAGPALPATMRVPKAVVINNVRFCFWHAPSGNSGRPVIDMFNGLNIPGTRFVLFGDLNCDPEQLIARGLPVANIIAPLTATRISGRRLDYAITNVPELFERTCRQWSQYPKPIDILRSTGSDHSPMILNFKG